jgi:hypothetical protein
LADTPVIDQVSSSGSSDDVRDWLEPGESWFCEVHHQIALAPEDIPEGYEQICLDCNPDVLALASVSPVAAEGDAQALFPSGVAYSSTASSVVPSYWTNCPTLIGDDQSILYSYPGQSSGSRNWFVTIRLVFSSVQSMPSGSYLWYSYSSSAFTRYSNSPVAYDSNNHSFTGITATAIPSDSYVNYVFSGAFISDNSGNTLYLQIKYGSTYDTGYFGKFYLAPEQYTGDGTGGGGTGGGTQPEEPGFDDPDGWLGGLIDSIIQGINEVIDGISNVATNVANLPSNIAGALSGLFQRVVSAVTSIGDQITNALTTLGNFLIDGLKQLFIPSDGFFESVANDLSSFFGDRLGLLLYPFDFLVSLGDRIAGLQTSEPTCTIPEIAYTDSDDNKYVLIEGQTLNVYDLVGRNDIIVGMHQTYLTVMDGIIAFTLMALCWKRFDHIIGGGAE